MKYLKKYKKFFEDGDGASAVSIGSGSATANASNVSGMGAVVSAQPGTLPGTFGTDGSGDIGFTFKKEKRKKGSPSEVSDLRDLKDVKTNKVKDIKESVSFDKFTQDEIDVIKDSILDLGDIGFKILSIKKDITSHDVEIDDDTYSKFQQNIIRLSLTKEVSNKWTGNLNIKYKFDKDKIIEDSVQTLRASGKELSDFEDSIVNETYDATYRILNMLDYDICNFWIVFKSRTSGEGQNIEIDITFDKNIHSDETY